MTAKRSLFNGLSDALMQAADRILVVEEGRFVAAGRYDGLIDAEPRFRILIRAACNSTHLA